MTETPYTDRELLELLRAYLDRARLERESRVPAAAVDRLLERLAALLEEREERSERSRETVRRTEAALPEVPRSPHTQGEGVPVVRLAADGASRGNPGPAAYGFVLTDECDRLLEEGRGRIGKATNNVAEYHGVLAALRAARAWKPKRLEIRLDSELVVRQLTGAYRVKNQALAGLFCQVMAELRAHPGHRIEHVPRERNSRSDRLANLALREAEAPRKEGGDPPRGRL